jgi:hypothetical protein
MLHVIVANNATCVSAVHSLSFALFTANRGGHMELQDIADAVRLPVRKIRYVLDQGLLPGCRGKVQKHAVGRARHLTVLEGCFIGAGALLLEAGVRRRTIRNMLQALAELPALHSWQGQPSLLQRAVGSKQNISLLQAAYRFAHAGEPTAMLIGDGSHLQIRSGPLSTAWLENRSGVALTPDYVPLVLIQLDLTGLRAKFPKDEQTARTR